MPRRQPRGRDLIRRPAQTVTPSADSELTIFAITLAFALGGVVFAFSPLLLNLAPASLASDALLSTALALLLWAILSVIGEFGKFGGIFRHEGWTDLFTTLVLALPSTVLLGLVFVLEVSPWIEMALTATALLLCLPVCLGIGATLDAFLIRPRLSPDLSKAKRRAPGAARPPSTIGILGAIATLITWCLSNVASFLTIVEQLFPGK